MKLLAKLLLISLISSVIYAAPQEGDVKFTPSDNDKLAVVYTFDEPNEDTFFKFVKDDLSKLGFFVNDPHHNVQAVYEQRYGKTWLENIAFSSLVNDNVVRPLINKDPRIGGFTPFNLLTFRKKSDSITTVTHMTPQAMLDILEIDDPAITEPFIKMFEPLDAAIESTLGGKKSYIKLEGRAEDTMLNFEIPFEEPEDIDDYMDEFQESFETAFEMKEYIIAGFYNLKMSLNSEDDVMPGYTTFWLFDLCHIEFSYNVFDGEKALPIAGIFAPCSMYVYVKEGENKIVIGMPSLRAWSGAIGVTDPEKLKIIDQLDAEITQIILDMGGKVMPNGNPLKR